MSDRSIFDSKKCRSVFQEIIYQYDVDMAKGSEVPITRIELNTVTEDCKILSLIHTGFL